MCFGFFNQRKQFGLSACIREKNRNIIIYRGLLVINFHFHSFLEPQEPEMIGKSMTHFKNTEEFQFLN